jgi:hypothetical protein
MRKLVMHPVLIRLVSSIPVLDSEKSDKFFSKVLNVKSVGLIFLFLVIPFSDSFYHPVGQGFAIDYAIIFMISFF